MFKEMGLDFAQQQRNPARHLVGFSIVIVLHIAIGYALVSGLARKVVEVIKQPLETKIIEELKKPPEDTPPPPPPKLTAPPPPFIPPPEVQIQMPVQMSAPAITTVTTTKPPPAPPPVVRTAPSVGTACPNSGIIRTGIQFPKEAIKLGLSGEVLIEFTVDGQSGTIKDTRVLKSSHRIFDRTALGAVSQFKCVGQGQDVRVQVPFGFTLKDE